MQHRLRVRYWMVGLALMILIAACGPAADRQTTEPPLIAHTSSPVRLQATQPSDAEVRSMVGRLLEINANSRVRRKFIWPVLDNGYGSISWNNSPTPTIMPTPSVQIEILSNQGSWQVERSQQDGELGMFGKLPIQMSFPDGTSKQYTIQLFLPDEQASELGWRGMCPEITNDLKIWVP